MNKQCYSSRTDRSLDSTELAEAAVTGQWLKHVALLLIFSTISVVQAQTQNTCVAELREANQKYLAGKVDAARDLLKKCVNKNKASKQDKVEAYKLLGKIYIAKDSSDQAIDAFKKMLKLNCQMTLDTTQETPEVIAIFNEVKKQQKCGGSKKLLWISAGGGLAVAGAIIFWPSPKEEKIEPLGFVEPPGRPR